MPFPPERGGGNYGRPRTSLSTSSQLPFFSFLLPTRTSRIRTIRLLGRARGGYQLFTGCPLDEGLDRYSQGIGNFAKVGDKGEFDSPCLHVCQIGLLEPRLLKDGFLGDSFFRPDLLDFPSNIRSGHHVPSSGNMYHVQIACWR